MCGDGDVTTVVVVWMVWVISGGGWMGSSGAGGAGGRVLWSGKMLRASGKMVNPASLQFTFATLKASQNLTHVVSS